MFEVIHNLFSHARSYYGTSKHAADNRRARWFLTYFKTQRMTFLYTQNTATVSGPVVMRDVNQIICHFPHWLYLEPCFYYSVCTIVFVLIWKYKTYQCFRVKWNLASKEVKLRPKNIQKPNSWVNTYRGFSFGLTVFISPNFYSVSCVVRLSHNSAIIRGFCFSCVLKSIFSVFLSLLLASWATCVTPWSIKSFCPYLL